MRSAILIAYIAGVPHVKSSGVLVPIDQSEVEGCKREFKEAIVSPPSGVERLEVWTSSGGIAKRGKVRGEVEQVVEPEPEPEAKRQGRPRKQ